MRNIEFNVQTRLKYELVIRPIQRWFLQPALKIKYHDVTWHGFTLVYIFNGSFYMSSNESLTTGALQHDENQHSYTMKLLFGPMFGCELHLPAVDYFIIINPGQALLDNAVTLASSQGHAAHYTYNTLYIPCDTVSPNIILRLSQSLDYSEESGFRVEIHDINGSFNTAINEKEIFTYKHICFTLKCSKETWPEEIQNFNPLPVVDAAFSDRDFIKVFNTKKWQTIVLGSVILAILLVVASVIWYKKGEYDRQILTLNEALAGAPFQLEIVKGRNNKDIYILAAKLQAMEWVRVAFLKLKKNTNVMPIWLTQQQRNTITHLSNAGYSVLQIDFSSPQHPQIGVYRQLTVNEQESLKTAVLQSIPFALDVGITLKTKNQLLKDARQGLDRLNLRYRQIETSTGYALIVRDALSDNALNGLRKFIRDFKNQWGEKVVTFAINLDENWLKNKSYIDSSNGYLFLHPRHWYFPLKQGDLKNGGK